MSLIEIIAGGMVVAIFGATIGALLASRNKVTIDELESHIKDSNPHTDCPVHTVQLKSLEDGVVRIERKVDELLRR